MTEVTKNTYRAGLIDGVPIGLGYLSVSFTFGIMASSLGIPFGYTLLISMTNLTSAGQLAGIGVIAANGSYAEIALTQLIINLRYALMSLSLSQKLDKSFNIFHRLAVSFGITDEIFAVAAAKEHDVGTKYMYGLITIPYIGWSAGTALGALAGSILPELIRNALGIALYGMFIAIVVPPARKTPRLLVVVGAAAGLSCMIRYIPILSFISDGFSIIICTLAAALLGALLFPIDEGEKNAE
ncbi:MAG: AzlC family ABC transporter permease [Clostridiales bacterium]|nr:AzlC family ABC transporter permease [Clostridiales bacterium]